MNKVNEDNSHIAQAILTLRENQKLSQEEFAKCLGVTRQAVSRWEMGISAPNIKTLVLISEKFEVSIDKLIKESADKNNNEIKANADKRHINKQKIIGFAMTGIGIVGLVALPIIAEVKRATEMALFQTSYVHSYDYILEYPLSILLILAIALLTAGVYTIIKSRR